MTGPDSHVTDRRRDAALAGHSGDFATALAALSDPAPTVRATALGALARMSRVDLGQVRAARSDPAPEVRARAAEVAATIGPEAANDIAPLLADSDPVPIEAACFALGEMGPVLADNEAVRGGLARVGEGHRDPLIREAAVAAIGAIGAPWGLELVLARVTDKPAVRRRAVLALASYEGPEVDAALDRALNDRDWQVRQAAEDLTGRRPRST